METMFNAPDSKRKCAPAVRESDAKFGKSLEDAAKNHRTNRERFFGRHTDEPRQPVFRHALFSEHVPWMHKDGSAELLGCTPDWLQRRVVQIQYVDATSMRIGINVRTDLHAVQSQ